MGHEVVLALLLLLYFLPAIVASIRRHRNEVAISMLNILLGLDRARLDICARLGMHRRCQASAFGTKRTYRDVCYLWSRASPRAQIILSVDNRQKI